MVFFKVIEFIEAPYFVAEIMLYKSIWLDLNRLNPTEVLAGNICDFPFFPLGHRVFRLRGSPGRLHWAKASGVARTGLGYPASRVAWQVCLSEDNGNIMGEITKTGSCRGYML